MDHFQGRIEFKNVWFAYRDEEWVLRDVSFTVEPGQRVAFVGATGAGKTTIQNLICRYFDIQKGQILIDGVDVKKIRIADLRRNIGQMLQDVFLFTGDVKSNIRLNEESITDEQVIEAAKYVNADGFISQLEGGYDHRVIERGAAFAAGICLAPRFSGTGYDLDGRMQGDFGSNVYFIQEVCSHEKP